MWLKWYIIPILKIPWKPLVIYLPSLCSFTPLVVFFDVVSIVVLASVLFTISICRFVISRFTVVNKVVMSEFSCFLSVVVFVIVAMYSSPLVVILKVPGYDELQIDLISILLVNDIIGLLLDRNYSNDKNITDQQLLNSFHFY